MNNYFRYVATVHADNCKEPKPFFASVFMALEAQLLIAQHEAVGIVGKVVQVTPVVSTIMNLTNQMLEIYGMDVRIVIEPSLLDEDEVCKVITLTKALQEADNAHLN